MRIWGPLAGASLGAVAVGTCSLITPLDGYSDGDSSGAPAPGIDGGLLPDGAPAGGGTPTADGAAAADAEVSVDGLVLHYAFEEGAGASTNDLSGKGHTAHLVGGATWGAGPPGKGTALHLNGSGAYASVVWTSALDVTERFTIAAWVRLEETSYNQRVAGHHDAWEVKLNGRRPQLDLGSDYVIIDTPLPVDQWVHLAFVYDRGTVTGYLDGVAHTPDERPPPTISRGDHTIRIGAYSGTQPAQFMKGAIDDLRIYDRALSAAEIAALAAK